MPMRSSAVVDLNLVKVRLTTNLENFSAYAYFPQLQPDGTPADYEVYCIDLDRDDVPVEALSERIDRTARAKRFRAGSYLAHYFGPPAYLMTFGRTFVVAGRNLERTVWPYFVKHILTVFAADRGYLHLKAGAFVQQGGGATLLVGRNGSGKTVFLMQACLNGGQFLTNTHLLYRDGVAHGVPSSIRVRNDVRFGDIIAQRKLPRHMVEGEFLASPGVLFGAPTVDQAPLRNLIVLDWNPEGKAGLEPIGPEAADTYVDQFSFAVSTYGVQDDLYLHYGGDFTRFVAGIDAMKRQLRLLTRSVNCYRANVDMMDVSERHEVLATLAAG